MAATRVRTSNGSDSATGQLGAVSVIRMYTSLLGFTSNWYMKPSSQILTGISGS